jgi:hypothetical protein
MTDFTTIDYLSNGNDRQKQAYEVLTKYRLFEKLSDFSPILAGTVPIEIDIEGSDLDILCEVKNQVEFAEFLKHAFSEFDLDLKIETSIINGVESTICNFELGGFPIEIFGQNTPTTKQNAYLHMIAEHKILQEKGKDFKQKIIELKIEGIKTEPAFGMLLNLENPYEDLLKF